MAGRGLRSGLTYETSISVLCALIHCVPSQEGGYADTAALADGAVESGAVVRTGHERHRGGADGSDRIICAALHVNPLGDGDVSDDQGEHGGQQH